MTAIDNPLRALMRVRYVWTIFGLKRSRITEAQVIRAAELVYRDWHLSEDNQIAALKEDGFSEDQSVRLRAFMPTAFVTPQLEEHGMSLHPEVSGRDTQGSWVLAKLRNQPEYVAALKLARRHRGEGVIKEEVYRTIAESSAEADVVRKAREQGTDLAGGILATSLIAPNIARYFLGPITPFPRSPAP